MLLAIRHLDTDVEDKWAGWAPAQLNQTGVGKVSELVSRLNTVPFKHIFSSDIPAAMQTAQAIAKQTNSSLSVHPELRSLNAGQMTGVDDSVAEPFITRMFSTPGSRPPEGESINEWASRVLPIPTMLMRGDDVYGLVTHSKNIRLISGAVRTGGNINPSTWQVGENVDPGDAVLITPTQVVKMQRIQNGEEKGEAA